MEIKPQDVLGRAMKALFLTGDFAAALDDFIWMHEHSLEHDTAFYGVRLSYGLGLWAELGKRYAPAKLALDEQAKKTTAEFLSGQRNFVLLADLFAVNKYAGTPDAAHAAFEELARADPSTADYYFHEAPRILEAEGIRRLA